MAAEEITRKSISTGFEDLAPVAEVFTFTDLPYVDHRIDSDGHELIRLDPSVPYPRDLDADDSLQVVLLKASGDPNIFYMPDDYVSLPHVLNEAAGASSGDRDRELSGDMVVDAVMHKLGFAIGTIAQNRRLVPKAIDYSKVIIERTGLEGRPILMPPVQFVPLAPRLRGVDAIQTIGRQLNQELRAGVGSFQQRHLASLAIRAFAEGAEKGRNNT